MLLAVVAAVAERSLVLYLAYCTVQILDVWAYTFTRDTSPIIGQGHQRRALHAAARSTPASAELAVGERARFWDARFVRG